MPARVSGLAVAYVGAGFLLLWSGLKGDTIRQTLTAFASGTVPAPNQQYPAGALTVGIQASGSTGSPASSPATDSAIASDALRYVGHPYAYGGAPGANSAGPWDCSSFCNWVLGHDFNMQLPGASGPGYSGTSHGPTTLTYLLWHNAPRVSGQAADAQAGDLCVWQTHMGIATGGGNMVSALNAQLGTRETTISGAAPTGEILSVLRIKSTASPALGGIYPTPSGTAPTPPLGVIGG